MYDIRQRWQSRILRRFITRIIYHEKSSIHNYSFISRIRCSEEKHEVIKQDNPLFSTSRAISLNQLGETINLDEIGIYNPTKIIKKDSLFIVLDLNGLNKISIYQENGK